MTKGTFLMEESFVLAAILSIKSKYLQEEYVTYKELNIIENNLQKEFTHRNLDVCITDEVNNHHFINYNEGYILNKQNNLNLLDIKMKYMGYCPSIEIQSCLWNEIFIIEQLVNIKKDEYEYVLKKFEQLQENSSKVKTLQPNNKR